MPSGESFLLSACRVPFSVLASGMETEDMYGMKL